MIPLFKVHMPGSTLPEMMQFWETLYSGYVGQGRKVEEFEAALTRWMGRTPVTVNSGTAAIVLALRLAGVRPGDAVITTPMTCTATNLPILAAGAVPVWADVDPYTGLLTPEGVLAACERWTHGAPKAVVCVDWGGTPCDLATLRAVAWNRGALLIEDAAHALGAEYQGRPVGCHADLTAFSFQAIKHITTVDGGALACLSEEHRRRGKLLRWYGIDREAPGTVGGDSRIDVDIEEWGYKAHMNDVAAALGLAQLPHLPRILEMQRANADFYRRELPPWYGAPPEPADRRPAWWLYTILLPAEERAGFKAFMQSKAVQVSQVHKRNDVYTVFRPYAAAPGALPGLDKFSASMVCIPVHWALTPGDLDHVVDACREFAAAGRS